MSNKQDSSSWPHENDLVFRRDAIGAVLKLTYADGAYGYADAKDLVDSLENLPSAQPEYYDYSDIEPLWKSFAEENDSNLNLQAKQLKDAMWCGYEKGKRDAQSDHFADVGKKEIVEANLPSVQIDLTHIIFETLAECGIYGEEATVKFIGTLKRLGRSDLLPPCAR